MLNKKTLSLTLAIIVVVLSVIMLSMIILDNKIKAIEKNQTITTPEKQILATRDLAKENQDISLKDETRDWKTYRNEEHGFKFKYPAELQTKEKSGINFNPSVISIGYCDEEILEEDYCEVFRSSISIYHYPSIYDLPENKSIKANNLEDYINEDSAVKFIGNRSINGLNFSELQVSGHDAYYVLMTEKEGEVYEVFFNNRWQKEDLTEIDEEIISSFELF